MAAPKFTKEEADEWTACPVQQRAAWGRITFDAEQFARRVRVGKKLFRAFYDSCLDEKIRHASAAYPPWAFYHWPCGPHTALVRILGYLRGFARDKREPVRAVIATATRFNVGIHAPGPVVTELVRVEAWSAEDVRQLEWTAFPQVFLDPLGFTALAFPDWLWPPLGH